MTVVKDFDSGYFFADASWPWVHFYNRTKNDVYGQWFNCGKCLVWFN